MDGHVPVLEELAAYQKKWELIRESSIHPNDPYSPHPAVVEPLVVSVFLCALRDLISRASVTQLRAANLVTLRQLSKTCENLRTFDGVRAEIGKIPVAELRPLNPTGFVAQSFPAGVPSTANAISSGTVLAATTSSGGGGGGGGVSHTGGNGGGISQFGGGGGYQVQGGGGGYQGAPSFFSAYAQQPQPALLQARSVKMLGSNAAADSRAGDPGDRR